MREFVLRLHGATIEGVPTHRDVVVDAKKIRDGDEAWLQDPPIIVTHVRYVDLNALSEGEKQLAAEHLAADALGEIDG